jgi:hypothetical protein
MDEKQLAELYPLSYGIEDNYFLTVSDSLLNVEILKCTSQREILRKIKTV